MGAILRTVPNSHCRYLGGRHEEDKCLGAASTIWIRACHYGSGLCHIRFCFVNVQCKERQGRAVTNRSVNGAQVARLIKDDEALRHIPIVMLTSMDINKDHGSLESLNVEAHLMKPARSTLLLSTLIDVIQASRDGMENLVTTSKTHSLETPMKESFSTDRSENERRPDAPVPIISTNT